MRALRLSATGLPTAGALFPGLGVAPARAGLGGMLPTASTSRLSAAYRTPKSSAGSGPHLGDRRARESAGPQPSPGRSSAFTKIARTASDLDRHGCRPRLPAPPPRQGSGAFAPTAFRADQKEILEGERDRSLSLGLDDLPTSLYALSAAEEDAGAVDADADASDADSIRLPGYSTHASAVARRELRHGEEHLSAQREARALALEKATAEYARSYGPALEAELAARARLTAEIDELVSPAEIIVPLLSELFAIAHILPSSITSTTPGIAEIAASEDVAAILVDLALDPLGSTLANAAGARRDVNVAANVSAEQSPAALTSAAVGTVADEPANGADAVSAGGRAGPSDRYGPRPAPIYIRESERMSASRIVACAERLVARNPEHRAWATCLTNHLAARASDDAPSFSFKYGGFSATSGVRWTRWNRTRCLASSPSPIPA